MIKTLAIAAAALVINPVIANAASCTPSTLKDVKQLYANAESSVTSVYEIRYLQNLVGVHTDGLYGPNTALATKSYINSCSLQLSPVTQDNLVEFYQHAHYDGWKFHSNISRQYLHPKHENQISSVRVADGYDVIIYAGENFTGESIRITDDTSYVGNYFNDIMSSFQIVPELEVVHTQTYGYMSDSMFENRYGNENGLADGYSEAVRAAKQSGFPVASLVDYSIDRNYDMKYYFHTYTFESNKGEITVEVKLRWWTEIVVDSKIIDKVIYRPSPPPAPQPSNNVEIEVENVDIEDVAGILLLLGIASAFADGSE